MSAIVQLILPQDQRPILLLSTYLVQEHGKCLVQVYKIILLPESLLSTQQRAARIVM